MLSDSELFVKLCAGGNTLAPPEVLEAIRIGSATGELQLSCMSILVPLCEILARVLASSSTIKKVDLSDCMLLSEGLISIINGLTEGSSVTTLSLKGNNITGSMVGHLGQIFMHNNTLKKLSIEWNSLGVDLDEFDKFCRALHSNHNIEEIDLRYNQISSDCAASLGRTLKFNKSLKSLDLGWNTLGLKGGEFLLDAIRNNSRIVKMNLRGNCIPEEIMREIEDLLHANETRQLASPADLMGAVSKIVIDKKIYHYPSAENEHTLALGTSRVRPNFSAPIERPEPPDLDERTLKVIARDSIDDNSKYIESSSSKIKELNKILRDRSGAIEKLSEEIATRTREAESARELAKKLENELQLLREERESFAAQKSKEKMEFAEIREKMADQWENERMKLEQSLKDVTMREKELEQRVVRYEREIRRNSAEMASLKEKMISQIQLRENAAGKTRVEIHRIRMEMRAREKRHNVELSVLKNTLKESTEELENCQNQLQKSRVELRETLENLTTVKTRLAEVEKVNFRLVRLEESYERVKDEKKILEEKALDSQRSIAALHRQVTTLQGELIEPQRRYDLVKEELAQEREKTARLKQELNEERTRNQELNSQIQSFNAQVTTLNSQINDMQNSHLETLRERDKERKALKDAISSKERDFNEFKSVEVQRANQLYAAFNKYFLGPMGSNPS